MYQSVKKSVLDYLLGTPTWITQPIIHNHTSSWLNLQMRIGNIKEKDMTSQAPIAVSSKYAF